MPVLDLYQQYPIIGHILLNDSICIAKNEGHIS